MTAFWIALRFVGFVIVFGGFFLLAREQRVTVQRGFPARPWFIAAWVGLVLAGAAVCALATLAG